MDTTTYPWLASASDWSTLTVRKPVHPCEYTITGYRSSASDNGASGYECVRASAR